MTDATIATFKELLRHINVAEDIILRMAGENKRMRAALEEIAGKGDVDADECPEIAKRALDIEKRALESD